MKKILCIWLIMMIALVGCGTSDEVTETISEGEQGGEEVSTLATSLRVDKEEDQLAFTLSLTNKGDETVTLEFPTGQLFDFIVVNEKSEVVYKYSEGMMFTQAIVQKQLGANETMTFTDEWDLMMNGERVPPGRYRVLGELPIMTVNGSEAFREQFLVEEDVIIE
ncbi:BsuPI-related putative proteinase inhibitor [Alkalihalobacterium chitinilyticum]|uniref:Intracellular proteinase inhibitor BsuPI domain-containing protein n=1 Tax=Alkalihalobacterium chitinilyticum TaxID=2980103 RepID=A0ABT5VAU8_9BACI|nr:BsuPI-related putative proteinase inhibitor [Alkalihalobacterium chitinilyticum]MDE5412569.1 BsuPI-related putative proteinase inhibitor [Alkalihalobacterium chitinilyticum]